MGDHPSYGARVRRSELALAALASAAVPGLRPVQVAAHHTDADRADYQSAIVDDVTGRRWWVRSPLHAAAGAELDSHDALVRLLGKHLPFKAPAAVGYATLGAEGRAAVYPYIEGATLDFRRLPAGAGLASAVGRAIAAVHNMPREVFEEAGVPVFDTATYRARKLGELDRAAESGQVPTGLLARWEQALDAAPLWRFTTTPTHGQLDGSRFLLSFGSSDDASSGRVVALTGWERAQVADPADDLADLVRLASPAAVETVVDSYAVARSQRPDGYLVQRARLAGEMALLHELAASIFADDEDRIRAAGDQLRRLDRLTSADDSLVPRTAQTSTVSGAAHTAVEGEAVPPAALAQPDGLAQAAEAGPDVSNDDTVGTAAQEEVFDALPDVLPDSTEDLTELLSLGAGVEVSPAEDGGPIVLHETEPDDMEVAMDPPPSATGDPTPTDVPLSQDDRLHLLYDLPADDEPGGDVSAGDVPADDVSAEDGPDGDEVAEARPVAEAPDRS